MTFTLPAKSPRACVRVRVISERGPDRMVSLANCEILVIESFSWPVGAEVEVFAFRLAGGGE